MPKFKMTTHFSEEPCITCSSTDALAQFDEAVRMAEGMTTREQAKFHEEEYGLKPPTREQSMKAYADLKNRARSDANGNPIIGIDPANMRPSVMVVVVPHRSPTTGAFCWAPWNAGGECNTCGASESAHKQRACIDCGEPRSLVDGTRCLCKCDRNAEELRQMQRQDGADTRRSLDSKVAQSLAGIRASQRRIETLVREMEDLRMASGLPMRRAGDAVARVRATVAVDALRRIREELARYEVETSMMPTAVHDRIRDIIAEGLGVEGGGR